MGILKVIGGRDKYVGAYINTTSSSKTWSKGLSPFYLGPVKLYKDFKALNVENGWQYSKLYSEYADKDGNPTEDYFDWAKKGWNSTWANRHPMGKGKKPLYSIWDGEVLEYTEARKKIYIPIYAKAVVKSYAYKKLKEMYDNGEDIVLWDFDGYDYKALGMTLDEVINHPIKKMGHAFVIVALLMGKFQIVGDNFIINIIDETYEKIEKKEEIKVEIKKEETYKQQSLFND